MQPVTVTVIGSTFSTPIIPDIKQNPFNIGIGVYTTAGAVTSWAVEHCFDFSTIMSPTWNGTTGVTWYPNTGLNSGSATLPANGNYAFPVAAIRLNITNAVATAATVMNLLQATNSP